MRISYFIIQILLIVTLGCNEKTNTKKSYFEDGSIQEIAEYNGSVMHGTFKSFFKNGKVQADGRFYKGAMDGEWTQWYDNGRTMSKTIYNKGEIVLINTWDEEGKRAVINGNGTFLLKFPDGRNLSKTSYKNSKPHGVWITWFPNGNVQSRIKYEIGKRVGKWEYWSEDGKLVLVQVYTDGRLVQEKQIDN